MIKAVIFDWAGTIVDFGCVAPVQAFIDVFQEKNIEITMLEAREPMGLAKRDHIAAICNMERIQNRWLEVYNRLPNNEDIDELYEKVTPKMLDSIEKFSEPIDNVIDTMSKLRELGIKLGSTTGYIDVMMDKLIPMAATSGIHLDAVVNSSDCKEGRPSPFMIFRNMEHLGIYNVKEILKVGDTVADVLEGKNAGTWTAAVTYSGNEFGISKSDFIKLSEGEKEEKLAYATNRLQNAGADFIINDISEIINLITEINHTEIN